jgi:hypothetical protein
LDWSTVTIFSPVTGKLTRMEQESAGTKIEIQSESYPAFRFNIFHVSLSSPLPVDAQVVAGQPLGHHVGSQTSSDIAVVVNDPTGQGRLISYFDTMTEGLLQAYVDRGMHSRNDAIISRAERDAAPLTCNGDAFVDSGTLPNWFVLE